MTKTLKILFLLLWIQINIFAENPDTTIFKITQNKLLIYKACDLFDVDVKILSSIIFVERRENFTWEDDAMDEYLAQMGLNSSIGFCQVKLKTAYWIENQLNDNSSAFYPGKRYNQLLHVSSSSQEIIDKLNNDSLNIMYAAAYLRIMVSRWESQGCSIASRPEILGTLYSTGLFHRNGKEREPNPNPNANRFGKMVSDSMFRF